MRKKLTWDYVRSVLDYNQHTGELTWKQRPLSMFSGKWAERACLIWKIRFAGRPAFTAKSIDRTGRYRYCGRLGGRNYLAHRIIFFWMTGRWAKEIDHDDGDSLNNRWPNLKETTHRNNQRNMSRARTYGGKPVKTPYAGLDPQRNGKFVAYIGINGKRHRSKATTLEEALAWREHMKSKHGFSKRHGT